MAVVQIPNLPYAIAVTGSEQLEAVQAGVSVRVTSAGIASLALNHLYPVTYITQFQFIYALTLMTPAADPNLLYQALVPDMSNPATLQFYTSPYVLIGSPIYVLTQSVYGYNDTQMIALVNLAYTVAPWG